jgi:hypothetical protein
MLKFLRRDPAAYITLVQGLLGLALAFHLLGLTAAIVPLIMAVINGASGVVTAILTKRAGFAIAMGLITAVINLFAGYGLSLTDDKQSAILFLSTIALGLFGWTQNSPADKLGLGEEPMPGPGPVVHQTIVSNAIPDVDVPSPYTSGTI